MPKSHSAATPLSAPGLLGPNSILSGSVGLAPPRKGRHARPYSHVRLEFDLRPELVREPSLPVLRQIEDLLRERQVVETGDALRLTAQLLHALTTRGFSRVDHWEATPGGWLPLPEASHEGTIEPVGHFLRALQSDGWRTYAAARSFAVRLSGAGGVRADVTVRRVHRERTSSVSLDLWGTFPARVVREVEGAIRSKLPVLRSRMSGYAWAEGRGQK